MECITIRTAKPEDIAIIQELAAQTWWPTYGAFLEKHQIASMLEYFFNRDKILEEINAYTLLLHEANVVAFALCMPKANEAHIIRIEKLYVLPGKQGKGFGKMLVDHIVQLAKPQKLELNVNRRNKNALAFYQKLGFSIVDEIDIRWGNYILDDYIMQKGVGRSDTTQ